MKNRLHVLKAFLIFIAFIFFSINFYSVNAEENLNINETALRTNSLITVGTFTTGDIPSGTISRIRLEGKDDHSQMSSIVYIYVNGVEVMANSVNTEYSINRVTVYTNNITLQPNTLYTITAKSTGITSYIRNLVSTVDFSNVKPVISNISSNVASIDINNESEVGFMLSGIHDNNAADNISFRYSFDNINYTILEGTLAGPVTNGTFNFNLNLYDRPEGQVKLYVKANDGKVDSSVVQITLNKDTTIPNPDVNIQVVDINSELGTKKLITTSEYGTVYYSINKNGLCNSSLIFTPLEGELAFEYGADNGKYVCYKVIFGKGQTFYKISNQITGIDGVMEYRRGDTFGGFKDWKSSSLVREGDKTLSFLKMMATTSKAGAETSTSYPSSLIDINGDGLIDMLYSNFTSWYENRMGESGLYQYNIQSTKYAIMINNGDYTFTPVYRCVYEDGKYYGNCVDLIEIGK